MYLIILWNINREACVRMISGGIVGFESRAEAEYYARNYVGVPWEVVQAYDNCPPDYRKT